MTFEPAIPNARRAATMDPGEFDAYWDDLDADLAEHGHGLTSCGLRIRRDRTVVLSDADVERIARRVVELLKEAPV